LKRILFAILLVALVSSCLFAEEPNEGDKKLDYSTFNKTDSGLMYKITQEGNGGKAQSGDIVTVHYLGTLEDGTKFDSSYDRNEPIEFVLDSGMVIKGWDEGIALLNKGTKATLVIPPHIAYGSQQKGSIPANSTLIFEVELVDYKPAPTVEPYDITGKVSTITDSGLEFILVETGSGLRAAPGNTVRVHYTGYFQDGTIFDSSVKRDQPYEFILGMRRVIPGWDEGVTLMKEGDKARLLIPYTLAYGEKGHPAGIPPKTDLIFDIELIKVK
jgi:peptidylprolyl isomerase